MVTVTSITGNQRKPRFVYNTGADMIYALGVIDKEAPITVHMNGTCSMRVGDTTYYANTSK